MRALAQRHQTSSSALFLVVGITAGAAVAQAQVPNTCTYGGRGDYCTADANCEGNSLATVCVDNACQIPCMDELGQSMPSTCSLGESCAYGETTTRGVYYCEAGRFFVDLNLLDMCVSYFLEGATPDLVTTNQCSLERNLGLLLDQDGNGAFNIFDVDGCIRAFLAAPSCDAASQSCPPGYLYCQSDAECGEGLYCDAARLHCQRECGFVSSREPNGVDFLERPCFGSLTACNYNRGRCEAVDPAAFTCQVDADCPAGGYCLLGRCAPLCSRSLDCPGSDWLCSPTNRCVPSPPAGAPVGFVFDPRDYAVQFTTKRIALDPVNDRYELPLAIMSLVTKKQVFDNSAVVFGYRLEVSYSKKQHPKCQRPAAQWTPAERADCLIDDTEQFVRLDSPFGTVYAAGTPVLGVALDTAAADRLTPGRYLASVTAIYSNGGQDSVTISFEKTVPSGEYTGRLSIYVDGPTNHLGNTNLTMQLFVDLAAPTIEWHQLLTQQNIASDGDLVDVTAGHPVHGYLHGNDSAVFNNPMALSAADNEILIKGIYSPQLGRMRLLAVIDLDADHCRSDAGPCGSGDPFALEVPNAFGRRIRRHIQFVGPFDPQVRRFHGIYRETVSGMFPFEVTLDGGFQIDQSVVDEEPVGVSGVLVAAAQAGAVDFPSYAAMMTRLDDEILASCAGYEDAADNFASATAFDAYLTTYGTHGPILPDLVSFEGLIEGALDALSDNAGAALTLYDYLQGSIQVCDTPGDVNCIDAAAARCGMALYRKALLSGWVDPTAIAGNDHDLFCSRTLPSPDCAGAANEGPTLLTLQEHNRFYAELFHAQRYEAGAALSDALFLLYRAYDDPIVQAQALSQKHLALLSAWRRYGELLAENVSPVATETLVRWPMSSFRSRGNDWLAQVHSILDDRLDALDELVDIKRRVFLNSTETDFVFVHHLLHHEYLLHVYLIELQRLWQQETFAYAGAGVRSLEHGDVILSRVNETRNPLGFHPNQIFFENSNLARVNWENYQQQILTGGVTGAGLLGDVNAAIATAVSDLQGALSNQNMLEDRLLAARQQLLQEVDRLCGSALPLADEVACPLLSAEDREIESNCAGPECLYEYRCEGEECATVVQTFNQAVGDSLEQVACRLDTPGYGVQIGSEVRPCVRGEMGALLQEKVRIELQRQQIYRQIGVLLRQIQNQYSYIRETQEANQGLLDYLDKHDTQMIIVEEGIIAANAAYDVAVAAAKSTDCWVIAGLAAGTNCPQTIATGIAVGAAILAKFGVIAQLEILKGHMARITQTELLESDQQSALRQQRMVLDNLTTNVENLISEYELVTQQLFNLQARLADTHFLARQAAARHQETVGQIIDHLIGSESGSALRRNAKVQEANRKFRELLRMTYKMAMAFIHSYNLAPYREQLTNQVFQMVTPQGVEEFVAQLDAFERDYCGASGLDCDAENNTGYFRLSLRNTLFPNLRDLVDPRSGSVLTRGEQFHNIITSSALRKKRKRGALMVEQIELPFAIWLNDRGAAGGAVQRWMVPPLECNHIIVGRSNGTMAVNVIGTRLTGNVNYEIWRGNTDFLRSCEPEEVIPPGGGLPVTDYPIRSYIVGYAPQHALARQDSPPAFVTHTTLQPACENVLDNSQGFISDESCYRFFARDRSLGAPDWKLVIPLEGGPDNAWLLGEGLPEDEQPVIEDIVLHIRYRTRPIE